MSYLVSCFVRCLPQVISQGRIRVVDLHLFGPSILRNHVGKVDQPNRSISTSLVRRQEIEEAIAEEESIHPKILRHPEKDRRKKIPVETSIRYMKSSAFKKAYGETPVWFYYRRNHKGLIPPEKTRKTCIRAGILVPASACPICRDEYLIVDYRNTELLKHFICPTTGEILSFKKTGVCQLQYKNLLVALTQAKGLGLITFDVPFRKYDYSEYQHE